MDIDPDDEDIKDYVPIFEFRQPNILGFFVQPDGEKFFVIDSMKNVMVLKRIPDSKMLMEDKLLKIKDKDRPMFKSNGEFPRMLISEEFIMFKFMIFYLFEDPLEPGILDCEDLEKVDEIEPILKKYQKKCFSGGPFIQVGSQNAHIVFNYGQNSLKYRVTTMQTPDSLATTLVADFKGEVQFSTFKNEDHILLQIGMRYLVFDKQAQFIDEAEFMMILDEDKNVDG